MPRLAPTRREELAEFEPLFSAIEKGMGFLPNSMLLMARRPQLLQALATLSGQVLLGATLSPEIRQLVAYVASLAAGCRYCQAHTSHGAHRAGASAEKVEAAFQFETSPLFTDGERAALRLARDASLSPAATGQAHFDELRKHYDEDEILQLVSIISLFGWLNRWNDTLATALESAPRAFAERHLESSGWEIGAHDGDKE